MKRYPVYLCGSLASAMMCVPVATLAADEAGPAAASMPAADDSSGAVLGEIVVTAQKRSESLNRVGLTANAISGDDMRAQGISSVEDIARVTPGLSFSNSYTSTPVYTLRGIGFNDSALSAYPDVSVYVDEVPLPFPALTTQAGLDLQRVEILKGPQGILFGTNATGGAINYIAAKPTEDLRAGGSLTIGRFGTVATEDYVGGGLTDTLAARLAVKAESSGDWQRSITRDDTVGKTQQFVGRLLLDWTPNESVKFELNLNGWLNQSDPQAPQLAKIDPEQPAFTPPQLAASPLAPADNRAADWSADRRPRGDEKFYQASLRGDIQATPDITITSISSYAGYTRDDQIAADGVAVDATNYTQVGSIHSFFQELRAANSAGDRFRWLVGGNLEHSSVLDNDYYNYQGTSSFLALGIFQNDFSSATRLFNYAGFGNLNFDLSPQFTLKAGARYTRNDRTASDCNADSGDGNTARLFTSISSAVRGTPTPPILPGQCFVLDDQFLPTRTPFVGKLAQSNVSWQAGLDYKPSDTALLYVNVTKGYKAGSFPNFSASNTPQFAAVSQESVLDYEAGFKVQIFDKKLYLTGAGFYYDYRDKQVLGNLLDPVFGVEPVLINVPKSSVKGAEAALSWSPTPSLVTSLSGTYLDTRVIEYVGFDARGMTQDLAGSPLPFSSKWSGTLNLEYRHALYGEVDGFIGGALTGKTRETTVIGAAPENYINEYFLVDLRAGIETQDGAWRASIWGKNVLDRYYWNNVYRSPDTTVRYAGLPATFGITLAYRFR